MKKLISLVVFAVCVSAPSFGAEHVLSRSTKVVSKESYKVAKVTVVSTAKATDSVVKFIL